MTSYGHQSEKNVSVSSVPLNEILFSCEKLKMKQASFEMILYEGWIAAVADVDWLATLHALSGVQK